MSVELTQTANINGKVITPLQIDRTLTKENMCADAKATGNAIRKIEEDNAIQEINIIAQPNISSTKGVCYKSGRICQLVFDFTTTQTINKSGVTMYADLPTPKDNVVFVAHTMDGAEYWLGIYPTETTSKAFCATSYVNDIPSDTRLFGTVTYITTD